MTEQAQARQRARLLLASIVVFLIAAGFRHEGDFESFYIAGAQFLKRLNPYSPELYQTYRSFGMSSLPPAIVLTCLPCLLPLQAAIPVWDIFCLMLWTASIYLWAELLWGLPIDWPIFSRLCAVSLIAPLCWAFATHQVIVPVFFFASLACWSTRRDYSGWAGLATGCMLMKPHLTLLLAAALLMKNNRKLLFISGVTAGLLLPYIPFMNTVRPFSDLRAWARTIERQQSEVYYLDEQGMAGRMASFFPVVARGESKSSNGPGVLIPKSRGRFLARIKTAFWALGCGLWAFWWGLLPSYRRKPVPRITSTDWTPTFVGVTSTSDDLVLYAGALAWGLLISPYSHFYDGVILTPLIISNLRDADNFRQMGDLFLAFFSFNFAMILLVVLANRYCFYMWPIMGWTSVVYCAFAMSIYGLLYNGS